MSLLESLKFFDYLTYDYKSFIILGLPDLSKKLPLPWARKFYKSLPRLDVIIYKMIDERKKRETSGTDILSHLLAVKYDDGEGLSDKEIRDELVTILFASYDTSARTFTWALYLLSMNPDILEKLSGFNNDDEQSAYLDMIISEALRIYPPAHSITRVTDKEDSYGQYTIPRGKFHHNNSLPFSP